MNEGPMHKYHQKAFVVLLVVFCLMIYTWCQGGKEKATQSILENEAWFVFKCNNGKPLEDFDDYECDTITLLLRKDIPLSNTMVYSWTFLRFGNDKWLTKSFEHTNEKECKIEDSRDVYPAGIEGTRCMTKNDTLILFGRETKRYQIQLATRQVLHLVAI